MSKPPPCARFAGSPVARATEILLACSVAEVAAVLANIAAAANGEAYELFRKASMDLRKSPARPAAGL